MNEELQKYVQEALKSGSRQTDIRKALVEAGWDVGQVDATLRGSERSPKRPGITVAVIMSLLAVGGIVGTTYFAAKVVKKNLPQTAQVPITQISTIQPSLTSVTTPALSPLPTPSADQSEAAAAKNPVTNQPNHPYLFPEGKEFKITTVEGNQTDGTPDVKYTLPLTIDEQWDWVKFEYQFETGWGEEFRAKIVTQSNEEHTLYLMDSGAAGYGEWHDTGLRYIAPLQGQKVNFVFEIKAKKPGFLFRVKNLTFYKDPAHGNRPPVAVAHDVTADADVNNIAKVTLDASGTSDPDGDAPLSYWWMITEPIEIGGNLLEPGLLAFEKVATVELWPGVYRVQLIVRDQHDSVGTKDITVTVKQHPQAPPMPQPTPLVNARPREPVGKYVELGKTVLAVSHPGVTAAGEIYYVAHDLTDQNTKELLLKTHSLTYQQKKELGEKIMRGEVNLNYEWNRVLVKGNKQFPLRNLRIQEIIAVGNQVAIYAIDKNDDDRGVVLLDGQVVSGKYGYAGAILDLNGKLAYIGEYPRRKVSSYEGGGYDDFRSDIGIGHKTKSHVVVEGKEDDFGFDHISDIYDIGGAVAVVGWKGEEHFVKFQGKEYGKEYEGIHSVHNVNGKLAFVASTGRRRVIMVYENGSKKSKEYEEIWENVTDINGKPAFVASTADDYVINYDGQEYGKEFRYLLGSSLRNIGGKLAFLADRIVEGKSGYQYYLYYDGREYHLDGARDPEATSRLQFPGQNNVEEVFKVIPKNQTFEIGGVVGKNGNLIYKIYPEKKHLTGYLVNREKVIPEAQSSLWEPTAPLLLKNGQVAFSMQACSGFGDCPDLSYLVVER